MAKRLHGIFGGREKAALERKRETLISIAIIALLVNSPAGHF